MRVIVTRPAAECAKWVDALAQAGFPCEALPLIAVGPAPDPDAVRAAWARIDSFDAVMFVSGNAVANFFALKPGSALVFTAQAAIKTRAFVIGPGSQAALQQAGVDAAFIDAPDLQSGQFDSEALWAVVGPRVVPGFRVLVVRGMGDASMAADVGDGAGRNWFANHVKAAGGQVEFVVAYQRCVPQWTDAQANLARTAASDGSVWLLSSSEALANLVAAFPDAPWHQARAIVTHARIAQAARAAGFDVVCESRPTLDALVASIESLP